MPSVGSSVWGLQFRVDEGRGTYVVKGRWVGAGLILKEVPRCRGVLVVSCLCCRGEAKSEKTQGALHFALVCNSDVEEMQTRGKRQLSPSLYSSNGRQQYRALSQ